MSALQDYIEHKNAFRELVGFPLIGFPPSAGDIRYLRELLAVDMSPENLTCDGELTGEQARKRQAFYDDVGKELDAMEISQ